MQSIARVVFSLRSACSSSGRSATGASSLRALSDAARQLDADGGVRPEGAKSTLQRLLAGAERPLTSAEVWDLAEKEGLKSKRFMKQMLQQMRNSGQVKATPMGGGKRQKSFGYLLPDSAAALSQQQTGAASEAAAADQRL